MLAPCDHGQHNLAIMHCFDLFFALFSGCLDSGVGHEQFNTLISSMNIPPVNHHTIKRAEEKVGAAIEKQAHESVNRALLEEKRLTEEAKRYVVILVKHCSIALSHLGKALKLLLWLLQHQSP